MAFDYAEDRAYFAALLCGGDDTLLETQYRHFFDFRSPKEKRAEFNQLRPSLLMQLLMRYGRMCMLQYPHLCEGEESLEVDHLIPLSSNVLNKSLRDLMAAEGKKVQTQSFGSNHPDNLTLACSRCNAFKKHRMPDAELLTRVLAIKQRST